MPLNLSHSSSTPNLAKNLKEFGQFLNYVANLSLHAAEDQYKEFEEVKQVLQNNFETPATITEQPIQALSINWVGPVDARNHYGIPNFVLHSKIILGSPKEIKTILQNLKPLTDRHAISAIVSDQPVTSQLSDSTVFNLCVKEIAAIVQEINQSEIFLSEFIVSDLINQPSFTKLSSNDLLIHLPLLSHSKIKTAYAKNSRSYNYALFYTGQIVTWLIELS